MEIYRCLTFLFPLFPSPSSPPVYNPALPQHPGTDRGQYLISSLGPYIHTLHSYSTFKLYFFNKVGETLPGAQLEKPCPGFRQILTSALRRHVILENTIEIPCKPSKYQIITLHN